MLQTTLKNSLVALYEPFHRDELVPLLERACKPEELEEKVSCPLYLSDIGYSMATGTKWLIVGQQTNSWYNSLAIKNGGLKNVEVTTLQQAYEDFNLGMWYKPTPFWGFARQVNMWIGGKHGNFLWTNMERVDYEEGRFTNDSEIDIRKLFGRLLLEEIKLLNPAFVIFAVGPSYNVSEYLPTREVVSHTRFWTQFRLPEVPEVVCFKTYHPRFLMSNSLAFEDVVKGFKASAFIIQ